MVLVGAFVGGAVQYWAWGLAIALDVMAAAVGGQREGWNLHADHFSERHSLFVIIALGESLIVAAGALTGSVWTGELVLVAVLAVAITCMFWWSYFTRAKPLLDRALRASQDMIRSAMARDAFSLLHFRLSAA